MKLIIFGPQGSGKGTQAKILAEKINAPHLSTGDLFRKEMQAKTELGQKAGEYINQGKLVPDDIVLAIVSQRLKQGDCLEGFILDGFPRTLAQATSLDKIQAIDLAIEIYISDEETLKRLSSRRSCANCGAIFNLISNPPKQESLCDNCGGPLVIREDDQPRAIKERLRLYHEQTEPLIEYYRQQNKHLRIDGSPAISEVTEDLLAKLSHAN